MKIKFLGAIGEVTGSCIWCVVNNGIQFLVDCGMFQGWGAEFKNKQKFPFIPERINFVLLTHAHMDHCGKIPLLYKRGFRGNVYCTTATRDLAKINLSDAVKQNPDMFNEDDVKKINFFDINEHEKGFGRPVPISVENKFWVNFTRSSHMLGAASITVSWQAKGIGKKIFFSGDVGNNREGCVYLPLLKRNQVADKKVDYVVLESTYGAKPSREDKYQDVIERINSIKKIVCDPKYKTVIFPCFALQRTQDVLFDLFCALEYCNQDDSVKYRIVLDSPMARRANKIFKSQLTTPNPKDDTKMIYLNDEYMKIISEYCGKEINEICTVKNIFGGDLHETDKLSVCGKLLDEHQGENDKVIYITSSGMCQEGKIRERLIELNDPKTALVLTGYQSTPNGMLLQKLANNQKDDILEESLDTNEGEFLIKDIQGDVFNMGAYYSGHADSKNLLRFLFERSGDKGHAETPQPIVVFLNHGDDDARIQLKDLILKRESKENDMRKVNKVIIPSIGDKFYDLDKGDWVDNYYEVIENQKTIIEKLDKLLLMGIDKTKKKKKKSDKKQDSI